ncbi:MAG: phosphoenolpyruvate synthase [Candidatus Nanoarchaeia archaeon]|nr:phosphoenolpyruvate synthase [Candidatus Nanoarchaeia archaeon]
MEKNGEKKDSDAYIKWFSELSNQDIKIAGGKGASLAEMYNHKFPVPPGFVITAQAFDYFLKKNKINEKIREIIESIETEDTSELDKKSKEIRSLVESQEMPEDLKREVLENYHILGTEKIDKTGISKDALSLLKNSYEPVFVSVRSSATAEDLADASFAGQQESFLNVKGDRSLMENIKRCFSSLFTPRAIYYRHKKGFDKTNVLLAVVIQRMVDSEKSGVIFSKDPTNQTKNIIIEAVYGLGEGIVSGRINPDNYSISNDLEIKNVKIGDKKIAITRDSSGRNTIVKLNPEKSKSRVLTNGKLIELANYALRLEEHYKKPQDIEFAIEEDKIYIVQSRPITTLGEKKVQREISGKVLLEGQGASPGIGVGVVRIIKDLKDLDKIRKGDVLVTEMTNPDMVVSMQKSAAIVTDEGGLTSHAAIVSREMGIPAVIGTGTATAVLQDGVKITVDGSNGKVYEGEVAEVKLAEVKPIVKTEKIKIKLILDLPEFVERAAQSEADSVGLLRLEGIIASSGTHPLGYEKENKLQEYEELLRKGVEKIASHFDSIWVRTSDIRTDEFDLLKGAPEKELNPMLGFHGIRFSLKHPKILEAELMAISKVAEKHPHKKFGVMVPQLISIEEVVEAKKHFEKHKTHNMVFGVMIETPSSVQIIEDICKEGVNFISFGTNDLTQFTLALDRGNEHVQYLYNEMHPAIFSQIKKVIETCKKYGVETSICGQAGSKKEMAEFLFKNGISSISVNADAAHDISILIKQLEEQTLEEDRLKDEERLKEEERMEKSRLKEEEEERERLRELEVKRLREEERLSDEQRRKKERFQEEMLREEEKFKEEKEKREQERLEYERIKEERRKERERFEEEERIERERLKELEKERERLEKLKFEKEQALDDSDSIEEINEDKNSFINEDSHEFESDNYVEYDDGKILDKENIKIIAELEEETSLSSDENSIIARFDNLDDIKEKSEKIQHEVWHENQKELERERKIEEGIEVEEIDSFDGEDDQSANKFINIFDEGKGKSDNKPEESKRKDSKKDYSWYDNEYG